MLMGIASQRYLLHVPDICDADIDEILRIITPALDAILSPPQSQPCRHCLPE
jgi:hypothetical protein